MAEYVNRMKTVISKRAIPLRDAVGVGNAEK